MPFDALTLFQGTPKSTPKVAWAQVDDQGHLVVPPEVAAQLGLVPGAQVRLEPGRNGLRLHRPVTHLARLYVEPTNACNLDCATCFRAWLGRADRSHERSLVRRYPGWVGRAG